MKIDLYTHIYPILFDQAPLIFPELQLKRTATGWASSLKLDGSHPKSLRTDKTVITQAIPYRLLEQGDGSISFWDYLSKREGINEPKAILQYLFSLAGVPFNTQHTHTSHHTQESLYQLNQHFQKSLFSSAGQATLQYLKDKRNYTDEIIHHIELGCWNLSKYNSDFTFTKDKRLGTTHTLTIPCIDPWGRLQGFAVRTIQADITPKYMYTKGFKLTNNLFGIHRAHTKSILILTEGPLDALHAQALGILNVVACGTNGLTPSQAKLLDHTKSKQIILCFDNDEAGKKATQKTISLLREHFFISVFPLPSDVKDLDEFFTLYPIKAFYECLKNSVPAAIYQLTQILTRYSDPLSYFTHQQQWEDILSLYHTLSLREIPVFLSKLKDVDPNIPIDTLKSQKTREVKLYAYQTFNHNLQNAIREKNIKKAHALFNTQKPEFAPLLDTSPYDIPQLIQDLNTVSHGLPTHFNALDQYIDLPPEALTIIGGKPSHGKTTLLLNLLINQLKAGNTATYFSYEENKRILAIKLISILANTLVNEQYPEKNFVYILNYIKQQKKGNTPLDEAIIQYQTWVKQGTLLLFDTPLYSDELNACIQTLPSKPNCIFIDYLQKIKTQVKGDRYLQIKAISEQLLESAKSTHLPFILGAQFNREIKSEKQMTESALRESADIEQDAHTVLGLWNEAKDSDKNEQYPDYTTNLNVHILKNRTGRTGDKISLLLYRPTFTLKD